MATPSNNKKPSNAQLQRRLDRAIIHIDRTKETKSVRFDDKGVAIAVNDDYAIIETQFHTHIFQATTTYGISRPYLYTKQFVDIAFENRTDNKDDETFTSMSYAKLFDALKGKEDKATYTLATYYDWWLTLIFDNLYSIGETEFEAFIVYFKYAMSLALSATTLEEHKDGMTNKEFVEKVRSIIGDLTSEMQEKILFPKKTDDDVLKENLDAMAEQDADETIKKAHGYDND